MTTNITVKTNDWPVAVEISDNSNFSAPERRSMGWSSTTEFVPAHTERDFHITDTRSISLRELHRDATSLDHHDELTGNTNTPGSTASAAPVKGQTLDENYQLRETPGEDTAVAQGTETA